MPNRRSFAKYTLVMFMGQDEDLDRILKKNCTPNTMRNLEKILDALRYGSIAFDQGFSVI